MTGRAIGLRTKNTDPAINLNPFTKLRIFLFPIIYIMLNGVYGLGLKKNPRTGVRTKTIPYFRRMQQLEIYQNGFDYSKWDDSSFKYNELNVALTSVQLGGGIIKDPRFSGFFVTIIYGVEYNGVRIFSFEGTVYYSYPKSFKSIHLLTFLCEKSINEFHDEFIKRKGGTPLQRYTINKRHVSELFDDIHEVLSLKHSQEQG